MKTLLKNGTVVNVFTDELERVDVLLDGGRILGVGTCYKDEDADEVYDASGKFICPGFIDGHIHIESTMMTPAELARLCVENGTTAIMADPHEITNVCGLKGVDYILESSENLPMTVYVMMPSCVPATALDEAGAVLLAEDLEPYYDHPRVLGLAEMMNYPGLLFGDPEVWKKIRSAKEKGMVINGHAPLLSGRDLDTYVAAGIGDDHETSSFEEASERIRKGQRVMIRQGGQARNLEALLPLFEEPWNRRCLLVTDDIHADILMERGHINGIIRQAVKAGKNPVAAIRMATLQAAECFRLQGVGAVAPGYAADIAVLSDLETMTVCDVFKGGKQVVKDGRAEAFEVPAVSAELEETVRNSFHMEPLKKEDFLVPGAGSKSCRVIQLVKHQLLTDVSLEELDLSKGSGIDPDRDILKLAVAERHKNTGHIGLGFLHGFGLKEGALASSVAHDSHNLVILGTNEEDMAVAGNRVRE
ncbi:MAG: adenine deaminase, partial [Firmicutes bacterium]|nr:adenine deaminase [Bacillota bacterium]